MIAPSLRSLDTVCICLLLNLSPFPMLGEDLDDLLNPSRTDFVKEDAVAKEKWDEVVDAFRRSDFVTATEKGRVFLASPHKATPFQVLGVQVMLALAGGENVAHESLGGDAILEADHLRERKEAILAEARKYRQSYSEANALINKLTWNRTRPVQAGSSVYLQCANAQARMNEAARKIDSLEREYKSMQAKLAPAAMAVNDKLKRDVIRLLSMLKEAQEVQAAFAICNVYLREFGPDLDVAGFQQDFVRLQRIQDRAVKVVDLIHKEQRQHISNKHYWKAKRVTEEMLIKVDTQSEEVELAEIVHKLMAADPYGLEAMMSKAESEAKEIVAIDGATAREEFESFKKRYRDFPDLEVLRIAILRENATDRMEGAEQAKGGNLVPSGAKSSESEKSHESPNPARKLIGFWRSVKKSEFDNQYIYRAYGENEFLDLTGWIPYEVEETNGNKLIYSWLHDTGYLAIERKTLVEILPNNQMRMQFDTLSEGIVFEKVPKIQWETEVRRIDAEGIQRLGESLHRLGDAIAPTLD